MERQHLDRLDGFVDAPGDDAEDSCNIVDPEHMFRHLGKRVRGKRTQDDAFWFRLRYNA